jgi:chloramphenicol O-acetyltransferase type A
MNSKGKVMTGKFQVLDLTKWSRKQQFEYFKDFSEPFVNVCCDLDARVLYQYCQEHQISFFCAYLYLSSKAVNQVESFCYRLVDSQVRIYQDITIGVAILAEDQTFRFCEIDYASNFPMFTDNLAKAKEKSLSQPFFSREFYANKSLQATVHMSVIPWLSFTGFTHATNNTQPSTGIPMIVFGKMRADNYSLPLSVDVHHALMDAFHIGQYVNTLQQLFDQPQQMLS